MNLTMATQDWLKDKIIRQPYPSKQLSTSKKEIRVFRLLPARDNEEICGDLSIVSLLNYTWSSYTVGDAFISDSTSGSERTVSAKEYAEMQATHELPQRRCSSPLRAMKAPASDEQTKISVPGCGNLPCVCYEALSYTWGAFSQNRTITVSDISGYRVSDNLYAALRRLRKVSESRTLWIDAICINQADLEERAYQVMQMGTIYQSAARTVVWLGNVELTDKSTTNEATLDLHNTEERRSIFKAALCEAVERTRPSWWERSWVIQEYVMAQGITLFQVGPFEMTWAQLNIAAHKMPFYKPFFRMFYDLELPGRVGNRGISNLITLICRTDATDPRDKVYSLLSMIRPVEADMIKPNYSDRTTCEDVYTVATYATIVGSDSLDSLAMAWCHDLRMANLPSWVVDFANKFDYGFSLLRPPGLHVDKKRLQVPSSSKVPLIVSLHNKVLQVCGLRFDSIRQVVPFTDVANRGGEETSNAMGASALLAALENLPSHDPYCLASFVSKSQDDRVCIPGCTGSFGWKGLTNSLRRHVVKADIKYALRSEYGWFSEWSDKTALLQRYPSLSQSLPTYRICYEALDDQKAKYYAVFVTECGFFGIGSMLARPGDVIAFLYGARLPSILHSSGEQCEFRGNAIVHGITNGELDEVVPHLTLPEEDWMLT